MASLTGAQGSRFAQTVWLLAVLCLIGAFLTSCAARVDPEATRESIAQAAVDPVPPDAANTYDAEAHPEPIAEPLECERYLVLTVRGTGEPSKGQLLSPVARTISEARPGEVVVHDLDYPADTDVKEGGTYGVRLLIDTLNVQVEECPEQSFILLGYSQGSIVIGDALSAPESRLVGENVGVLAPAAAERIRAVVLYGDPRFHGAEPYNTGSYDADLDGILPRASGALGDYADRIRDYCVAADFMCQSTFSLDESGHVEYYENGMQQDGAAFVITQLEPVAKTTP